jgi:hypothetical protein
MEQYAGFQRRQEDSEQYNTNEADWFVQQLTSASIDQSYHVEAADEYNLDSGKSSCSSKNVSPPALNDDSHDKREDEARRSNNCKAHYRAFDKVESINRDGRYERRQDHAYGVRNSDKSFAIIFRDSVPLSSVLRPFPASDMAMVPWHDLVAQVLCELIMFATRAERDQVFRRRFLPWLGFCSF